MVEELRACPMCGERAALSEHPETHWWYIDCEADTEGSNGCGLSIVRSTRPAVIAAWNLRSHEDRERVYREAVGECICPKCGLRHGGNSAEDAGF